MNHTPRVARVLRLTSLAAVIGISTALAACADKAFTPSQATLSRKFSLQITATGLLSQVATKPLFLMVGAVYRGPPQGTEDDGIRILSLTWSRVVQGTQSVTLPVDIAPCLADATRLGSKDGCTMYLAAGILPDSFNITTDSGGKDPFMNAYDVQFPIGPFDVVPGRAPTIPAIDLSLSRFGAVAWEKDEALRLGGAVSPNAQSGVLGIAPLSGYTNGAGSTVIFALSRGSDFPAPTNNQINNFQTYPQLQINQNGKWRRLTATTAATSTNFNDVSALTEGDVYISSTGGLYHYDGSAIAKVAAVTDSLNSVASVTAGTSRYVIAGGEGGVVWIGNTATWQRYTVGVTTRIDGVCITGPNEAFASSSTNGGLFRFNGTTWTSVPGPTNSAKLDLQCPAAGQAYVLTQNGPLLRWSGTGWTQLPTTGLSPGRLIRWGVLSSNEIYAYGDSANVDRAFYRFDGATWREISRLRFTQSGGRPWPDARGGGAYVLSSFGRVERMTATSATAISYMPPLRDAIMTSATSAFVVGWNAFLARWDGVKWTVDAPPPATQTIRILQGVWSDGPKNAWAVGNSNTIYRYDGTGWSVVSDFSKQLSGTPDSYNGVWGSGADVWIAGSAGITHCRSTTSCSVESGGNVMYGLWGSSSSNIFAIGAGGRIQRYNGTAWTTMNSPTSRTLVRISGSGASDVWAVGDSVLVHYDGTQWTDVPLTFKTSWLASRAPSSLQNLFQLGLWARGPKELYMGGDNGQISRWDGTEWREVTLGEPYLRRIIAITGAGGCAIAITEGQTDFVQPTVWRGIGPSGCQSSPMVGPTNWP